jgi:hypothetical protein
MAENRSKSRVFMQVPLAECAAILQHLSANVSIFGRQLSRRL